MASIVSHFFIATPDADDLDLLDATFASLAAQNGDFSVTYLVNDPDGALGVAQRLPAWRLLAEKRRSAGSPVSIVVSHYVGLSIFDVLDLMLADVPNTGNAVLGPLPFGSRLAEGALAIVSSVLERWPEVGVLRGLTADFGQHGVITHLGFGPAHDTWRSIAAAANSERDQRDLSGGMFWRAPLWHRVGRMDPALTYAGYLDFGSKAAMHSRLGQVQAFLMTDRHRAISSGDAVRQEAEIVKVQRRAALRQKRVHDRMIDGETGDEGLKQPLRVAYNSASRTWTLCDAQQYLDTLGVVEIEAGFLNAEGPYPASGLPSRFRWTSASLATFVVEATQKPHRIHLRLRNPSPDQAVALYLNGTPIHRCRPPTVSLRDAIDIDMVCDFRIGRNTLALTAEVMLVNEAGQSLGLIVEDVEIAASAA